MNKPIRHRQESDGRPEFKGLPFTSTRPLDNDERLELYLVKRQISDFFKTDQDKEAT